MRALQVLAYYEDPATRKLLLELGQSASGPALTIVLGRLSRQPDRSCLPLFEKGLVEPTEDRVRQAIAAYRRVDESLLIPALVPLTKHPDQFVAREAVRAVTGLPPGKHAGLYLDAVLGCKGYETCSPLVNALIKSKWNDPAAIRPLGEKLGQTADRAVQYQIILLLQALSGDATLGPKEGSEFWNNPAQWVGVWKTWASSH